MAKNDSDEYEVLEDEPRSGPKPKVTILTMILIFLNMAAALAFLYLMSAWMQKRQTWAFHTFTRNLWAQGLPLKEEDNGQSGSRVTLPRQRLSGDALRAAFLARGGSASKVPEPFHHIDEEVPHDIEPRHMTEEILRDYFGSLGNPVPTLEDEVLRQKDAFPKEVAKAANDFVEKVKALGSDEKRRAEVRRMILPTTITRHQFEKLLKQIDGASGDKLLEMLDEGIQRRMLIEALTPMEVLRPGKLDKEGEKFLIASTGDLETYSLDELKRQFQKRMDAVIADKTDPEFYFGEEFGPRDRGSLEKRDAIGMALMGIASVHLPNGKYLDENGIERVQKVLGLWEFAKTATNFTNALTFLYGSPEDYLRDDKGGRTFLNTGILHRIHEEREGYDWVVGKGGEKKLVPGMSFLAKHEKLVKEIGDLQRDLHIAQKRMEELERLNALAEKTHDTRVKHLDETVIKLNKSRANTADLVSRARELQAQIIEAQRELLDAAEANYRLEAEIRSEQLRKKGGTP